MSISDVGLMLASGSLAGARVEALEAQVANPEEVKRLGPRIQEALTALAEAKGEVERLYQRWSELSELEPYG